MKETTQHLKNQEKQALALLNQQFIENKEDTLVYGEKECQLAIEQKCVQLIWRIPKFQLSYKEKEFIIYGFTTQGIQFQKEYGIIALLYPGSFLEK